MEVEVGGDQVSVFCLQVDFELLSENLVQLERRCKASWDNLKVVAKHETKTLLKNKMTEFLKDCTHRIIILKVVHRRVINRCTAHTHTHTQTCVLTRMTNLFFITPPGSTPSFCSWVSRPPLFGTLR